MQGEGVQVERLVSLLGLAVITYGTYALRRIVTPSRGPAPEEEELLAKFKGLNIEAKRGAVRYIERMRAKYSGPTSSRKQFTIG